MLMFNLCSDMLPFLSEKKPIGNSKRGVVDGVLLGWQAAPRDFRWIPPSENPLEQQCQPSANTVHPSSLLRRTQYILSYPLDQLLLCMVHQCD